jgi:hypothetical protein
MSLGEGWHSRSHDYVIQQLRTVRDATLTRSRVQVLLAATLKVWVARSLRLILASRYPDKLGNLARPWRGLVGSRPDLGQVWVMVWPGSGQVKIMDFARSGQNPGFGRFWPNFGQKWQNPENGQKWQKSGFGGGQNRHFPAVF